MSLSHESSMQYPPGVDIHADKGPWLVRVTVACIVLSFVAVVLRFLSRAASKQGFKADDWIILAALPFAWVPGIQMIHASRYYYLGRHVYVVTDFSKIEKFWLNLYIAELIYPFSIVLTKISILLFLYRIFHVRKFKLYGSVIGVIVILWGLSTILPATFSCTPIPSYWRPQAYPSHTCISTLSYFLGNVIPNLLLDIALLILPLPWLWNLHIALPQKIALSGVFLLGGFVTVVGAMRLATIARTQGTKDFTWDFVELGVWTSLEMNVGIVGACVASLGPLLRFLLKGRWMGSTKGGSGKGAGGKGVESGSSEAQGEKGRQWPGQRSGSGEEPLHGKGEQMGMVRQFNGAEERGRPIANDWVSPKKAWEIQKATEITVSNKRAHDSDDDLEQALRI